MLSATIEHTVTLGTNVTPLQIKGRCPLLSRLELASAAMRARHYRIAELVAGVIQADNGAVPAVYGLLGVACLMARYLEPVDRARVVERMQRELQGLVSACTSLKARQRA
jgi:hypothetical protein